MKYKNTMLVVKDLEKSKEFYRNILGLRVISDLGVNVTLTGGLALQSEASWMMFTGCQQDFFKYGGNVIEVYFEEEDYDGFIDKLHNQNIALIGEPAVMPWGQKVVRFYDPDKHVIEVGEDLKIMMIRMHDEGMDIDALAERTGLKKGVIQRMLKNK